MAARVLGIAHLSQLTRACWRVGRTPRSEASSVPSCSCPRRSRSTTCCASCRPGAPQSPWSSTNTATSRRGHRRGRHRHRRPLAAHRRSNTRHPRGACRDRAGGGVRGAPRRQFRGPRGSGRPRIGGWSVALRICAAQGVASPALTAWGPGTRL